MTVITPDLLRSLVLEGLRKPPAYGASPLQAHFLWQEVAEIAQRRGLKYKEQLPAWHHHRGSAVTIHPNLEGEILDIVWDLIVEGVLRPGQGQDGDARNFPYIHLTEYGKSVISEQVTPYDPEGYLKHLKDKVPTVDPVILRYVTESAATLRQNCLLSTTVMLGGASEQAFLLLFEAFRDALNPADLTTFDRALNGKWMIKPRHEEFMQWYGRKLKPLMKPDFGTDGLTNLEMALTFVFNYFRTNRNEAGHPSDASFKREISAANLVMFPGYLRSIYDAIEWLTNHKPL